MADGIAGLTFVKDMIAFLGEQWTTDSGGAQPDITAQWNKKTVGFGGDNYQEIIISLDSENPNIYSLLQSTDADVFFWDWLHDISITLDIRTGDGEDRVLQMVDEVVRILKLNVITAINGTIYVQILPGAIVSLLEEYRNMFRYTVDVDCLRFNP